MFDVGHGRPRASRLTIASADPPTRTDGRTDTDTTPPTRTHGQTAHHHVSLSPTGSTTCDAAWRHIPHTDTAVADEAGSTLVLRGGCGPRLPLQGPPRALRRLGGSAVTRMGTSTACHAAATSALFGTRCAASVSGNAAANAMSFQAHTGADGTTSAGAGAEPPMADTAMPPKAVVEGVADAADAGDCVAAVSDTSAVQMAARRSGRVENAGPSVAQSELTEARRVVDVPDDAGTPAGRARSRSSCARSATAAIVRPYRGRRASTCTATSCRRSPQP